MILRRLSQSLKQQNWTAIWIEFVLLVAGVFLGIQVANWNAAQQDNKREADFIERLERDFEKIDARLTNNISTWDVSSEASVRLLADLEAFKQQGSWQRSKPEILQDLDDVTDGRVPAPRAATYVELLSAGQLGIIRNTKLRDALLDYDMQVGYSQTAYTVLMQRSEPHMTSIVSHLTFDGNRSRELSNKPIGPTSDRAWSDVNLQGLGTDPKLKVALNIYAIASNNQIRVAKMHQEKARAVMAILKPNTLPPEGTQP